MAKSQLRGNREAKKPKQEKKAKPAESPFAAASSAPAKGAKQRPGA